MKVNEDEYTVAYKKGDLILDLFINKGVNENRFSSKDSQIINIFVAEIATVLDTIRIMYIINLKSGNRAIGL